MRRLAMIAVMSALAAVTAACSNNIKHVERDGLCIERDTGYFLGLPILQDEDICPKDDWQQRAHELESQINQLEWELETRFPDESTDE